MRRIQHGRAEDVENQSIAKEDRWRQEKRKLGMKGDNLRTVGVLRSTVVVRLLSANLRGVTSYI